MSPLPTGGAPIDLNRAQVAASEDGDRVVFSSYGPFPDTSPLPEGQDFRWFYTSERGDDGWQVEDVGLGDQSQGYPEGSQFASGPSADASSFISDTQVGLDPDDQNNPANHQGQLDLYQRQPDGSLVWISRDPRIPAGTPQTASGRAGAGTQTLPAATMSTDGRTVAFVSTRSLADDDTTPGDAERLYKWTDGELNFIGERPDGSVPSDGSRVAELAQNSQLSPRSAVARDGTRVVFSAKRDDAANGRGLYIQTDGESTVEATKETGVAPLPANQPFPTNPTQSAGTLYRGASSDVSRVFLTSPSRLTADSGAQATSTGDADLYVYDIAADKVRDISPQLGPDPDGTPADRAAVQGVPANSEDGKRVYFVAEGAYPGADPAPNGDTPADGDNNLYIAELDGIDDPIDYKFIAALGNGDDGVWTQGWGSTKTSYASPDGSVLGFGSSQDDLTNDAKDDDLNGTEQLFVYDAATHSQDCASCPSDGSLPAGDVNPGFTSTTGEFWQTEIADKRWISSAGSAFFYTAEALLPADHNVTDDVYEYKDGQLELISTGRSSNMSRFDNASRDGSTVFFTTTEALDPRDNEPGVPKLYAARVGGGFPAPPTPPAPCEGDECKDDSPGAPDDDDLATGGEGAGNPTPTASCDSQASQVEHFDDRIAKLKDKKKRAKRKAKQASGKKAQRKRKRAKRIGKKIRKVRGKKRDAKRDLRACRGGSQ